MSYFQRIVSCLAIVLYLASHSLKSNAAQSEQAKQSGGASSQEVASKKSLDFNINPQVLAKNNLANESFWLDINDEKILVLKYWARGKVSRGNAIVLHAQGEHADHPRITANLSKQLSQLGWHVYIPSLPNADYPISINQSQQTLKQDAATPPTTASSETTQQNQQNSPPNDATSDQNNNFFADEPAYQEFVNQILDQLMQAIQPQLTNLVLVANQNSGYWSLATTKNSNLLTHVVLIEPQIPEYKQNDLEQRFGEQSLPVFTFIEDEQSFSEFITAFERQLWRSPHLRINRGQFSNQGIEIEDIRIAKSISGWIQSQQKSN